MKFSKSLFTFLVLLVGCLVFASTGAAIPSVVNDRILTVGSGSGNVGATVNLPITIDDNSGVAGTAFTLSYNHDVFTFLGIQQINQTIDNGSGTNLDYTSTMFYQVNDSPVDANNVPINGRVMVAAATAQQISSTTLFNARFQVKERATSRTYTIGLSKTVMYNPQAGYYQNTLLPALVGIPATSPNAAGYYPTPTYDTDLVSGSITVTEAASYSISGTVNYDTSNGSESNGSTVTLSKLGAGGTYFPNGTTTVSSGAFSFSNKSSGTYRLIVLPYDSSYSMANSDIFEVSSTTGNVTRPFVLQGATAHSGTVYVNANGIGTGNVLDGVRVKVSQGDTVYGIYPINAQGYFETVPLPAGSYTFTAMYGDQTWDISTAINGGQVSEHSLSLHSITGTVYLLDIADFTVQVVSKTTKMLKTITVESVAVGGVEYQIDNLLPGSDYIVSAVTSGVPVLYYNQSTTIVGHTPVAIPDSKTGDTYDFNFTGALVKGTISGTVVDDATPVGGVGVIAVNIATYTVSSDFSASNDGSFSMTVPAPGTYALFSIINGKVFYYNAVATTHNMSEATLLPFTSVGGQRTGLTIDIAVPPCSFSGTVSYENGDPLVGAVVIASNTALQAATVTTADGSYVITGLGEGNYQVGMNPMLSNYALQFKSVTITTDPCNSETIDFTIDTGNTISGDVTNLGGDPIFNALIYMIDEDTGELAGGRVYFSKDDGSGNVAEYSIGDLPNSVYTLVARHPEYDASRELGLNILQDTTQDITFDKGAYIDGTTKEGETSLEGVTVIAVTAGEMPSYTISNSSGEYVIYGLTSNTPYLLIATKQGYQRSFTPNQSTTTAGMTVAIDMTPLTATFNLTGNVTRCNTSPLANAQIIASYDPGSGNPNFVSTTTTNGDGDYSFTSLPQVPQDKKYYSVTMVPLGNLGIRHVTIDGTTGNKVQDFAVPCSSPITGNVTVTTAADSVYVILINSTSNKFVDHTILTEATTTEGNTYAYSFEGLSVLDSYYILMRASGNITSWYDGTTNGSTDKANAISVYPGDTSDMTLLSN